MDTKPAQRTRRKARLYPETEDERICSEFATFAAETTFVDCNGKPFKIKGLILASDASHETRRRMGLGPNSANAIIVVETCAVDGPAPEGTRSVPEDFQGMEVYTKDRARVRAA